MIAFFISDLGRARRLAKALHLDYEGVDGPFRTFDGDSDSNVRIYVVPGNADAAYAAARIAARRGAKVLIPIAEATLLDRFAEDQDVVPGMLIPVRRLYDLAGLQEPLRILPDSCKEFPFDLESFLPAKSLWKSDVDGIVAATMPGKIRNHFLGVCLFKLKNIACFDRQLAGYAAASTEEEIELRPVVFIDSVLGKDGLHAELPLGLEQDFDRAVLEIGKASRK